MMRRQLLLASLVLVWAIGSILLVWRLPLWIGAIYVVGSASALWWLIRRDQHNRSEQLAAADDLQRAEEPKRGPDRPSGLGYGAHSWGQRRRDE